LAGRLGDQDKILKKTTLALNGFWRDIKFLTLDGPDSEWNSLLDKNTRHQFSMSIPDSLQTGTVTFLFTDIEGSTKLLQRLGDQQGVAWAQHKPRNVVLQHEEYVYAIELFRGSLGFSREIGYQWGRAFSLEDLASCSTMQGDTQRALTLAGAAEGIRYTIGMLLSETAQAVFDATLEPARQALTDQDSILAWEQGKPRGLEDLVSFTQGERTHERGTYPEYPAILYSTSK